VTNYGTISHLKSEGTPNTKTILQNGYRWKGLIKEIPEQKELRNNINSVPSYKQYKQKQQNNY
jgi:hypothetical protein